MTLNNSSQYCEFHSDKIAVRLDKKIPGKVDAIEPVIEEVMKFVAEMKCADGNEFQIELALREALANAILHGCQCDPEKEVQMVIGCEEDRGVLVIVRDPGPGFEPESIPSPIAGKNIYSNHGRGIYLINQMMDEVSFQNGGTEIRMVKR